MNIIGCQHQIVLAYFIYKMVFNDRIDCKYYCNNCIYNHEEVGQVPMFEAYNITAKLSMIYMDIAKYFDLLLSHKRQRLLTKYLLKCPKTVAK